MRIVSWNILDGGEGRADPLAEVLLAQRPDVVALVEADDPAVLDRIARRLDMDYIHAPGRSHASALLSRWPIQHTINHGLLLPAISRSFLEASIIAPDGQSVIVGVVHLHAHAAAADEQKRLMEINAVLQTFSQHRTSGQTHFLAGDFNAVSPVQQIRRDRLKPSSQTAFDENGGQLPRDAVKVILDSGHIDTLAAFDPQAARDAGTFSTQHPGQRVDYIFSFGIEASAISSAWIETDRLARYASDHFPVGVEIGDRR